MGTYLGQNFLTDIKIRQYLGNKIKEIYEKSGSKLLIEIGPGKGSLTKLIHHISSDFFVIEKDDKLVDNSKLKNKELENVAVILGDVLEIDVDAEIQKRGHVRQNTLIVGNLPYYITSPILRTFFGEGQQTYVGGVFMVQKEVADKLCTDAKKKSYLWRRINFAYDVIYLKTVAAKSFSPAPNVTSAIIELKRKNSTSPINFTILLDFLQDFAPYSRKTLGSIATMIKKKKNKEWVIPEGFKKKRLEALDWSELGSILG